MDFYSTQKPSFNAGILRLTKGRSSKQKKSDSQRVSFLFALVLTFAIIFSGCSGGGSGSDNNNGVVTPPSPNIRPPSGNSLSGPRPNFGPRSYVLYESGQVRPLALSKDGQSLFAVNTPDNRLEIFDVSDGGLAYRHSVPVGMEPVAVAQADDGLIWVVNHLSDSISIVDASMVPPRVKRTLWTGDEPRDIVFAGNGNSRAFVSTAHRGQNSPVDPGLTTPGIGRADVWVFNRNDLGAKAGGSPETILTLFGDRPRGLARNRDGSRVFAAVFLSGNQTTTIPPPNLPKPPPHTSADGVPQPDTGLITKFDGANWVSEDGTRFNNFVPFSLPDFDVFEIDALAEVPEEINRFSGIGTVLFNLAVHPVSEKVFVSNTESRNHVRFAGPGARANSTVQGRLADHRISIIDGQLVSHRNLNKHLDFSQTNTSVEEKARSLSTPMEMVFSPDGQTLYVVAFGSSKIGVFDVPELEDDDFVPDPSLQVEVTGGGPSGIVLDENRGRAYVLTRFDNGISVIDLDEKEEIEHVVMYNPEPAHIVEGRPFLYDARLTSGRGNDSCATCHVFGDTDALAWDLGDPDGEAKAIPNTFIPISPPVSPYTFHPMKGPMTTQSMRGIKGHGPMHWRGDRTGADRVGAETLEEAAFKEFNEAFVALMGREDELSDEDMQAFTDFAMELSYPPNPIRNLDNSLNADQAAGFQLFQNGMVRQGTGALEVCGQCHLLDPANGIFGTGGLMSDNSQAGERNMKIPHFRDQYQKVGMFGWGFNVPPATGPQVRGFGYNHNGATSGNFLLADLGTPAEDLRQIRAYLFAFPTESAPIVGQQVTVDVNKREGVEDRVQLFIERALIKSPVPECDLIVKGVLEGSARGWMMNDQGQFVSDRSSEQPFSLDRLMEITLIPGQALTFTCVPWGAGRRMGIDRNLDGILDKDE